MTSLVPPRPRPAVRRAGRLAAAALPLAAVAAAGTLVPAATPSAGESIYRLGQDSSGRPLRAVVSRDVPVSGPAAACIACHQRSGFGSFEGTSAAPPVLGRVLFAPRADGVSARPAYGLTTLEKALREGVDPAGRPLDLLMPRYDLETVEIGHLLRYLASLSAGPAPGVDATTLHLATVVTPDADPRERRDTLDVLQAYVKGKNGRTRGEGRAGKRDRAFREWRLHVWALEGPERSWRGQLETLYREQPVFALVSGAGGAGWSAIHEFAESHEIPSVLPNLDVLPAEAGTGFYNLYFSPGVEIEAEAFASALAARGDSRPVQVVGGGSAVAVAAANALRIASGARGGPAVLDVSASSMREPARALAGATDVILWLGEAELAGALEALGRSGSSARLYLSSTLLGEKVPDLPDGWAERTTFARPYALPAESALRFRRTSAWLRSQGIEEDRTRIQDQTLAACGVLGEALMHVGSELVRDYVVERIDHGGGMQLASAFYRNLAFGPSQRILSRGCYLVPGGGEASAPAWVTPGSPRPRAANFSRSRGSSS